MTKILKSYKIQKFVILYASSKMVKKGVVYGTKEDHNKEAEERKRKLSGFVYCVMSCFPLFRVRLVNIIIFFY